MKVHYINILLFAHALNILVNTHKKPSITTQHTPKIPTTRALCECDLYAPANYDNDPQMKEVMEHFNKQTQQRFHEYDERLQSKRQRCKERCAKEIQKIIFKDKLEKELMDKFATLDTNIQTDAIPKCVCEKSIADKTEQFCLNCGKNMGAIAPWWGLVCGSGYAGWEAGATAAAIAAAEKAGIDAGVKAVIAKIEKLFEVMLSGVKWPNFISELNYDTASGLVKAVTKAIDSCAKANTSTRKIEHAREILTNAEGTFGKYIAAAKDITESTTRSVKTAKLGEVTTQSTQLYTGIVYSVLAIIIIVLIMVIIYLILRYRRKKKMKKKLQYIKLLEE
ncbi:PIR protein [Plasmodium sp. DRC-Itaito]|nr:PIR protein [Plasmodium sp. DRC-Itaito]